MRYLVILQAVILCFGFSTGFCSTAWPNEPTGSTQFVDCPFSNSMCPPLRDLYPGQRDAYASFPATNQLSPSYALDTYLAANSSQGMGMWGAENLPYVKEIYVGTWWSTNADFMGMSNNSNKMIFINGVENSLLDWMGSPGQPKKILWVQQAHEDNCHVAGYVGGCWNSPTNPDGTGHFIPNVNAAAATVAAGSGWHQLEIYRKASTSNTSKDGIIRIWVDGVLTSSYSNVNQDPGGFSSVIINQSWDGVGTAYCSWRDCTKSWHHYWDHLRISFPRGAVFNDPPRIITGSLPAATSGRSYSATLTAEGGKAPYNWTISSGSLLPGLSLNKATGVISGTPTTGGKCSFTVKVLDSSVPPLEATKPLYIIASGTSSIQNGMQLPIDGSRLTMEVKRGSVRFALPQSGASAISVYDLSGREVWRNAGNGEAFWNHGGNLKRGVYLVRAEQGGKTMSTNYCHVW